MEGSPSCTRRLRPEPSTLPSAWYSAAPIGMPPSARPVRASSRAVSSIARYWSMSMSMGGSCGKGDSHPDMPPRAVHRCDNPPMDQTPGNKPDDTTHFGFRDVPAREKQKLVGQVFSSVAGNYDLMNDLMSLGIHRAWKRYYVATSQVRRGDRVLDLAGGTGDIAALLRPRVGASGSIVLGDINGDMLRVGRDRMIDRGHVDGFEYVQCNAEALPFP